jgi:hypothetical protein
MKVTCPTCGVLLPAAQVNVAKDLAVCPKCEEAFSLSALLANTDTGDFDIHQPPPGAWFEETMTGWRIGDSTRSPAAIFLIPFLCVWSGLSLGGIYGIQIAQGQFNPFLALFGIPFVLGTLFFGSYAVMMVCGQVVVSCDGDEGSVFTGVGPFGWTRRFDWSSISAVEEEYVPLGRSRVPCRVIALLGQSKVQLGRMLNEARGYYLLRGLRTLLAQRRR